MTWKKRLLTAKHWQIFLLLFGAPIVAQMIAIPLMTRRMTLPEPIFTGGTQEGLLILAILLTGYLMVYFGWMFAIATELQKLIVPEIHMKVSKFKVFWTVPLVYFFVLLFLMGSAATSKEFVGPDEIFGGLFFWFIFFHLFAMLGVFYSLYFCAKSLATAEAQKPLRFIEVVPDLVLFWMLPVGIWVLQPRLNKLMAARPEEELIN